MPEAKNQTPKEKPETPPAPETPPPAAPQPAASGSGSTAQATAAVSSAVSDVRERLVAGEQIVLVSAAVIVGVSWFIFQFLLDYRIWLEPIPVVVAILTVLGIWIHRWGHYDFGKGYRIVIGALGLSLALLAVASLLAWVRVGGDSKDFLHLLGRIIYWVSGIAAGYGAWLVFRIREE